MGKSATSVAVLYASEYGFGDRLSQTLARGITKSEVATEMVDLLSVEAPVRRLVAWTSCGAVYRTGACGGAAPDSEQVGSGVGGQCLGSCWGLCPVQGGI